MAQQQTTAVERWAATHPVRVKDRPSIDPTVHPRPSELASEAAAREVARARGPGPPHRRALPASSGTEMLSTHLGPGCPPATDPPWCLQVVRRRTQRRKSGLTSLLFGELCAARAHSAAPCAPATSKLWEPGVGVVVHTRGCPSSHPNGL